jgi:SAM-dependent methyltransferase
VLDAGCGTGFNLCDYVQLGRAYGLEPDRHAAALGRSRSGAPVVQGDLLRLPFRSGSFDLVVCTDVLEHIAEDSAALSELARVLRPAGTLILTVPACPWAWTEHDRYLGHVRRYDCRRLGRLTRAAGLSIVHFSRYNVLLGPPLVAFRRLTSRSAGRSDVGRPVPQPLQQPLHWLFQLEASLSARLELPFGLSHVLVARRGRS